MFYQDFSVGAMNLLKRSENSILLSNLKVFILKSKAFIKNFKYKSYKVKKNLFVVEFVH